MFILFPVLLVSEYHGCVDSIPACAEYSGTLILLGAFGHSCSSNDDDDEDDDGDDD